MHQRIFTSLQCFGRNKYHKNYINVLVVDRGRQKCALRSFFFFFFFFLVCLCTTSHIHMVFILNRSKVGVKSKDAIDSY